MLKLSCSCLWILCLCVGWRSQSYAAEANPSPVGPAKPSLTILTDWRPRAEYAGLIIADTKGFFRDAGLKNVSLQWSQPGDSVYPELIGGQADFCVCILSEAIIQRSKGVPVVQLAQLIQSSSIELVTKRSSGIVRLEDLDGRRVAMWNCADDCPIRLLFLRRNVKPVVVQLSHSLATFLRDAADAVTVTHYGGYNILLQSGLRPEDLRVFRMADYGFDLPEDGLFCLESTLAKRPGDCAAVVAAVRRGWEYALAHEEEALDIILDYCERNDAMTNRPHQRWMLHEMSKLMRTPPGRPRGSLAPDAYRRTGEMLKSLKLIDNLPPYREFHRPPGDAAIQSAVNR